MAIAFARVSIHTRSKGHSAVAGAAYRSGSLLTDERTGIVYNFENRHDIVYQGVLLPEGASEIFLDRNYLWNKIEEAEKRKDSQVAKDIVLALPRELGLEAQIALARNFSYSHFVSKGLASDIAIHNDNDGNPHAHLYVTTRRILGSVIDNKKARDLNPSFANSAKGSGFIIEDEYWGEKWRTFQNEFFLEHGLGLEVDENYLISQRHAGSIRRDEKHYLKEENSLRKQACLEIALTDPEALLNIVGNRYAVFSDKDIERTITKNVATSEQRQAALASVMSHESLIYLGRGDDGRKRYTTSANYLKEVSLSEKVHDMFLKPSLSISNHIINKTISQLSLNNDQVDALYYLAKSPAICAVVGRAGTGKSYMMQAARKMWEEAGFRVKGAAPSGVAAQGLEKDAGIPSHTLAYYRKLIENNLLHLTAKDVLILDEAGMADLHDMFALVDYIQKAGAKLVLVGDHAQLQPVGIGAPFRAIIEQIGFVELNTIMRQHQAGDRQATSWLAQGKVKQALEYYQQSGCIHYLRTEGESNNLLLKDWLASLKQQDLTQLIIVAHTNKHVNTLNKLAREELANAGKIDLSNVTTFNTSRDNIELAVGERVLFLKNDKHLGVKNGQFGTVHITENGLLTILVDGNDTPIQIDTNLYRDFTYGYAATVHKTQGTTFNKVYVAVSGYGWDKYLTYVALSRHKESVSIYSSKEQFNSLNKMTQVLSQERIKDNVIDFPLAFGMRRGFNSEHLLSKVIMQIAGIGTKIRNKWRFIRYYEAFCQLEQHKEALGQKQIIRENATKVALFCDWHQFCNKKWAAIAQDIRKGKISYQELYEDKNYHTLIAHTHKKNQMAAFLLENYPEYEKAFSLNRISYASLEKAAKSCQLHETAKAYVDAFVSKDHNRLETLVTEPIASKSKIYPRLVYHAALKKVPSQEIYRHFTQDREREHGLLKRIEKAIEHHENCKTRFAKERSLKVVENLICSINKNVIKGLTIVNPVLLKKILTCKDLIKGLNLDRQQER